MSICRTKWQAEGRHRRSFASAIPWPPPMHIVISARLPSIRPSSSIALTVMISPVAPTGWPSAIAPPFGFTRALSTRGAADTAIAARAVIAPS